MLNIYILGAIVTLRAPRARHSPPPPPPPAPEIIVPRILIPTLYSLPQEGLVYILNAFQIINLYDKL